MKKDKLDSLTKEQLEAKAKSIKLMIGIFIVLILALTFFTVRDYMIGKELDWAIITIIICTIGGPVSVYPELQQIKEKLDSIP